jgi:hypothetical protein
MLEIVLNSQSEMGALTSGSITFRELSVVEIALEEASKEGNSAEGNGLGDRCRAIKRTCSYLKSFPIWGA